jgi:hypothetical protein
MRSFSLSVTLKLKTGMRAVYIVIQRLSSQHHDYNAAAKRLLP